jgi:large subunit ribosomal protein L4
MEVSVFNTSGSETGRKANLPDAVFGIEPNQHAIYLDVKSYLANQRQGTHKSKQRNEVKATTKKLKKQKGTGGARAGSMKSPLFIGGGRVFGPVPRDYSFKLNKKVKQLARKSALSSKASGGSILVLEDFSLEKPSTKAFVSILNNLKLGDTKTLLVTASSDKNTVLSSRNYPKTKVTTADNINTYDILNNERLIICEGALSRIEAILS